MPLNGCSRLDFSRCLASFIKPTLLRILLPNWVRSFFRLLNNFGNFVDLRRMLYFKQSPRSRSKQYDLRLVAPKPRRLMLLITVGW